MMHYLQSFVFAFLATVAFGVLFQGPKRILWRSGLIGGLGWIVFIGLKEGFSVHSFSANFLAGLSIGIVAQTCCLLYPYCTLENITVGALMPFLPGLAFTNGVRDYMAGDLLSGNSRIAEAGLFALSIAIGLAFALKVWDWGGLP